MTALPPSPFITDSAEFKPLSVDTAVASERPPVPVAAAVPISESSMSTGGHQEAPAVEQLEPPAAGATDHIHEIFHYARLLIAEDNAVHRRFVLDEAAFMDAIDEPPLFLRAGGM